MATTQDYIEYVCEQLSGSMDITYKKMFGEYMVYANKKPVVIVCDNTAFVKQLDIISEMMKNADKGFPYKGAKEHYVLDIDNKELAREVVTKIEAVTPIPKPRKKKEE